MNLLKVVWLHNGSEVTYNGPRTGVSLIIDKSEVEDACTTSLQSSDMQKLFPNLKLSITH